MPEPLTPAGATPDAGPPSWSADSPAASPGAPPARPLTRGAGPERRRSEKRALLLAGAALGVGGFLLERATSNSRPQIVHTQTGWRITEVRMLGFSGLALHDERIAWQDGASILLLDLRSGKAKSLGPGDKARATWQPAMSERYVVWFEGARVGASSADAWTYDVATRRRQITTLDDVLSFPSVSGTRTVWCTARDAEPGSSAST